MNETIEFSLIQVIGIWKGDIHQIKNLVHDNLPAKAREIAVLMTTTNIVEETTTSPTPSYQLEQRMGTGMQTSIKPKHLKEAHHSYQADQSPAPSYQLEQRMRTGMQTSIKPKLLKEAHHSYQADQSGPVQSDDHAIPHDYYSGAPEPQPGSYPGSEQLTSKNTMYAELQGSLVTQEEGLLL